MSTDPFSDIAFQQEIGQPTYAELIYTEVRVGKTFPPSTATVENSLARLAYGKSGPYRDVPPQTPPKITAVPPHPTRRKYNISGQTSPQTLQALKAQRVQDEFRRMLTNPSPAVTQALVKQSGGPSLVAPFDTVYQVVGLGIPTGLPTPGTPPACNKILNPTFDDGIANWSYEPTPKPPPTWNSTDGRMRMPNECVVSQTVSLPPGTGYRLTLTVYSISHSISGSQCGFSIRASGADLVSAGGDVGTSRTVEVLGTVPSSGNVTVEFTSYTGGGECVSDIDNVYICSEDSSGPDGQPPACNKVVNPCFDTGVQNWVGATGGAEDIGWDSTTGRMILPAGLVYQVLTGLTPGKKLHITANAYWGVINQTNPVTDPNLNSDSTWNCRIWLRDGFNGPDLGEQVLTGKQNSQHDFDFEIDVPASGIVYLFLQNNYVSPGVYTAHSDVQFDNVFACEVDAPVSQACDNAITSVRSFVSWNGVPRQPVNIFNMIARLTYRDANDPLSKTVVDMLATQDGRTGTVVPSSCGTGNTGDFWKQQGNGGTAQSSITASGLNLATTPNVTAGQFASVTGKSNWLWSIPGATSGTVPDSLASIWPDGEDGILESVEFLFLAQAVNPTGLTAGSAYLIYENFSDVAGKPQLQPAPFTAPEQSANFIDGNLEKSAVPVTTYFRTTGGSTAILGTTEEKSALGQDWSQFKYIGSKDFLFEVPLGPPYSNFQFQVATRHIVDDPNALQAIFYLVVNGQIVAKQTTSPITESANNYKDENLTTIPLFGDVWTVDFNDVLTQSLSEITIRVELFGKQVSESDALPQVDLALRQATVNGSVSSFPTPTCAGPFTVEPDPAQTFDFTFRYVNSRGQSKGFTQTFSRTLLYQTTANFPSAPNSWDAQTALGNGVRGSTARWQSAKFVLDAVDGSGLDQCTTPIEFVTSGRGTLNFKKLQMDGRATATAACDAEVLIEEVNKGVATNEIQSIILPSPSGGTWTLAFNYGGQNLTTHNLQWDATANQVKNALQDLANIGIGNVKVTGNGTVDVPFDVEFIGLMGARDLRMLKADGSKLTGSSSAFFTKLSVGTLNERQTITKNAGVNADLLVKFSGVQSIPIPFNASLDTVQAALEGINTIGAGNVAVTGNTSDREADYQGPWYVDFIGGLAGQNVGALEIQTTGYSVVTNWHGGTGVNDIQKLTISASAGTFTLTLVNPADTSVSATTDPIVLNAGANQIKSKILAACTWYHNADLTVTKIPASAQNPDLHEWTIEFTGDFAHRSIPLIGVNSTTLAGADVIVRDTTKGTGSSERQKVSLYKAQGGSYRLTATINGVSATTVVIPWDADAEGIEFALQALPIFPLGDDVSVKDTEVRGEGVVASFIVTFNRRFGDVALMTAVNNLQCNPLALSAIGPPPYDYVLPKCDDEEVDGCSPGELLCRPGEGDPEVPEEVCCDQISIRDSANVYREVMLQRDLFDPNTRTTSGGFLTIRDMAVLKGLRPSQYHAYLRDFHTGVLRPVEMTTPVDTKMSVLLIGADIDTKATRERLSRELKRRPGILPSRMSWSNPALQG